MLRLGRPAVVRALLDLRQVLQRSVDSGYLLNRIWTDDYCVWIQQLPLRWLGKLADKLEGVEVSADKVRWPLRAYEDLAREVAQGEDDDEEETDDSDSDDEGDDQEIDGAPPEEGTATSLADIQMVEDGIVV
mmetsp:Transcript_5018/g.13253  ORF Transcript_5018/g.13253 Transcript_5018/m.13253 type:complete len:132 (+) Transcript_5018:1-396(+)